jgi:predicted transcriptional regulator
MEHKVITAHLPLDLATKVDDVSARLQRPRGWIVKQALEEWLARQAPGGFTEAPAAFSYDGRAAQAAVALKELRENTTLGGIPWQELRDAGRK